MNESLRELLWKELNIRCVFPFTLGADGCFARCMLENEGQNTILFEESTEDVVVKAIRNMSKSQREACNRVLSKICSRIPSFTSQREAVGMKVFLERRAPSTALHPGIASIYKIFDVDENTYLFQAFTKNSLLTLSRFHAKATLSSPTLGRASGLGSRDQRLRFIIYQLLQAISFIHDNGLTMDKLVPGSIMLDDDMWVTLPAGTASHEVFKTDKTGTVLPGSEQCNSVTVDRPIDYYEPITVRWAAGKISNFEYLMAINAAAGRSLMDPLYHPILPWVTDFSCDVLALKKLESKFLTQVESCSSEGSSATKIHIDSGDTMDIVLPTTRQKEKALRDLSKTKFRLSKGDHQLETTFRHSDPSHHVPESLSELTYYIYLARRTPMQVLRRVVRDVFVPEHYPLSMSRMYEWTPDECIPEFYSDEAVFSSIHKQEYHLPDLELPSFAPTPSEFIRYHRGVLESDEVSSKLHLWIDLTFGHCLQGQAAEENMNVPLRHTLSNSDKSGDSPKLDKHPGFVMLFSRPHPMRRQQYVVNSTAECQGPTGGIEPAPIELLASSHLKFGIGDSSSTRKPQLAMKVDPFQPKRDLRCFLDLDHVKSRQILNTAPRQSLPTNTSNFGGSNGSSNVIVATNGTATVNNVSGSESSTITSLSSALNSSGAVTSRQSISMEVKKSLNRPVADPTLGSLIMAAEIDFTSSSCARDAVKHHSGQSSESRFASLFGTLLEPAYSLPTSTSTNSSGEPGPKSASARSISNSRVAEILGSQNPAVSTSFAASTTKRKGKSKKTSFWDVEFENAVNRLRKAIVSDERIETRSDSGGSSEQADDMFSLGCIIAEIFSGEPLLSLSDARDLAGLLCPESSFSAGTSGTSGSGSDGKSINQEPMKPSESKSKEDPARVSVSTTLRYVYRHSSTLPLVLRRLIAMLIQPEPLLRPTASEVLQTCCLMDQEGVQPLGSEQQQGYVDFNAHRADGLSRPNLAGPRVEILESYCSSLFPSYFQIVFALIGRIKLCRREANKVRAILESLDSIVSLPLEGLSLALPHLLEVVADPTPFRAPFKSRNPSYVETESSPRNLTTGFNSESEQKKSFQAHKQFVRSYPIIIDAIGSRLGCDSTEKLLVPAVVAFLNQLQSTATLQLLLDSQLWNVLILRAGVPCFLRNFLPALLTYLEAGTLQKISKSSLFFESAGAPMWTNTVGAEQYEWLHVCDLAEIRNVQQSVISTLISLAAPDALGIGLCTRYVMPALLCLVGVPQLSSASFGIFGSLGLSLDEFRKYFGKAHVITTRQALVDTDRPVNLTNSNTGETGADLAQHTDLSVEVNDRANSKDSNDSEDDPDVLEKFIATKASYDPQDMYIVKAIVALSIQLGEMVTAEVVLSKIFNCILPELQLQFTSQSFSSSVTSALMEVILLLNGLLPSLTPKTVIKSILQPAKASQLSLPRLLNLIPLRPFWSIADATDRNAIAFEDVDTYIENQRSHVLLQELCRLIVSSAMIAGPAACSEYVLPSVDVFFQIFVETYSMVPIESRTMMKGFELGAELFLPLAQLTGPEAFYTAVHHLNPRLEMWLLSVGSGGIRTSPPLPANILPEVVQAPNVDKNKKKGIFQWISSKPWRSLSTNTPQSQPQSGSTFAPSFPTTTPFTKQDKQKVQPGTRTRSTAEPSDLTVPFGLYSPEILEREMRDETAFSPVADRIASCLREEHGSVLKNPSTPSTDGMELKAMAAVTGNVGTPAVHSSKQSYDQFSAMNEGSYPQASPIVDCVPVATNVSPLKELVDDFDSDDDFDDQDAVMRVRKPMQNSASENNNSAAVSLSNDFGSPKIDFNVASLSSRPVSQRTNRVESLESVDEFGVLPESVTVASVSSPSDMSGLDVHSVIPVNESIVVAEELDDSRQTDSRMLSFDGRMSLANSFVGLNAEDQLNKDKFSDNRQELGTIFPISIYKNLLSEGDTGFHRDLTRKGQKKQSKVAMLLTSKMSSAKEEEEEEVREMATSDSTWLLAGKGRWNIAKEVKAKRFREKFQPSGKQNPTDLRKGTMSLGSASDHSTLLDSSWNPAAQMSMTAPRISTDVASEASSLFAFGMTSKTQFRVDEGGPIRTMVTNHTESLLLTSSKSGIKIFSLTSHPLKQISTYTGHNSPPFAAAFLRSGLQLASCDGCINLWDIETGKTLGFLEPPPDRGSFTSMECIPPRIGVTPSLGVFGDNQILSCLGSSLIHHDIRIRTRSVLKAISEWTLPPLPVVYSHFSSNMADPVQLVCATAQENLIFAGSASGCLWTVDRRMGKVLSSWQGHDSSVLKVTPLDRSHFFSISERTAYVWECKQDMETTTAPNSSSSFYYELEQDFSSWPMEVARVLNIRNTPDIAGLNPNTVMLHTFEQSNTSFSHVHQDIGIPPKPLNVLYCIAGHKMYAGRIPSFDDQQKIEQMNLSSSVKETVESEEVKLTQTYFCDRNKDKLPKQKLNVSSSVMLPLRRLLLLGTDEGIVRVVS